MTHTGRERSQDKKSHLSLLCAPSKQGQGLSIALQAEGREQICLHPAGPGRERVSCVEQLEQHMSPEGGLKCPFSWLTFLRGTEGADGCTGRAWEHQVALRTCLQPPLVNTIQAPSSVQSRPHSGCVPWDSHLTPLTSHISVCEGEIRQGRGIIIRGFPATVVCSSQLLNFHYCNFLDL